MTIRKTLFQLLLLTCAGGLIAACSPSEEPKGEAGVEAMPPVEKAAAEANVVSEASADTGGDSAMQGKELPVRKVPGLPETAEPYYAPDNYHFTAQTQDPDALRAKNERSAGGALTYIFTDDGKEKRRINDHGQDACAYFSPDGKWIAFTSTRDHMDMPVGNWSDPRDYPQGAELYVADLEGNNIRRLTNNEYYEAEVSISPDGKWIVFGRQIDGKMDLWKMRWDGTDEQQITFTDDWQEGAPFFLPDSRTITTRAWKRSEYGKISPTPMTIFTIDTETGERVQRTFDHDMNWAPYPAPDGRHYVFVRVTDGNNWEIFLGDLAGKEPNRRLTFNESFDGFPSLSPDGTKMLFTRSEGGFMSNLYTYVMDVSSLDIGPDKWTGEVPGITPPEGWEPEAE